MKRAKQYVEGVHVDCLSTGKIAQSLVCQSFARMYQRKKKAYQQKNYFCLNYGCQRSLRYGPQFIEII